MISEKAHEILETLVIFQTYVTCLRSCIYLFFFSLLFVNFLSFVSLLPSSMWHFSDMPFMGVVTYGMRRKVHGEIDSKKRDVEGLVIDEMGSIWLGCSLFSQNETLLSCFGSQHDLLFTSL